jgi:hypothetical protein
LTGDYESSPLQYLYLAKYELKNDVYNINTEDIIFTFCENNEPAEDVKHTFDNGYA